MNYQERAKEIEAELVNLAIKRIAPRPPEPEEFAFEITELGRAALESKPDNAPSPLALPDLTWLLPENDPVSPKSRRLTERQQDTLIRMYKAEKEPKSTGMYISQAANQNNFYKRLQARRLVHLVECYEGYRGVHCMKWQLTEMGRTIASGLLDLPF